MSPTSGSSQILNQHRNQIADPQILKKMKEFAGNKTVSQLVSDDLLQKQKRLESGLQYHQDMNNFMNESKKAAKANAADRSSPYIPSYLQGKNVFERARNN